MKMKTILSTLVFFCLTYAAFAWTGEATFVSMSRSEIQALADQMIDSSWTPHTTFSNYEYTDAGVNVYRQYNAGTTYYGVAYGQGYPQNNWAEFSYNMGITSAGNKTYGNDCSGFVSICWKLTQRYNTAGFESSLGTYWTSLGAPGSVASVNLLLGDALNSPSPNDEHMVMFLSYNSTGINTMEQTISGPNHLAKRYTRSYTYLANNLYRPIRRNQIIESMAKAQLTSPTPGTTLGSSSVNFGWNTGSGVSEYYLYVGNSAGGSDIYNASQGTSLSRTVTGIPIDGRTIYVRLWSSLSGGWQYTDYTYKAFTGTTATKAQLTSPTPGTTLGSSSVNFGWNTGSGVSEYYLYVGNSAGGSDIYNASQGTSLSRTVTGIPTDGRTIYVRLWSNLSSGWQYNDYTYTAFNH